MSSSAQRHILLLEARRKAMMNYLPFTVHTISLADLGGGLRGLQPPPLGSENFTKKGQFLPFLGLQPPPSLSGPNSRQK